MSDEQRTALQRDLARVLSDHGIGSYELTRAVSAAVQTIEIESERWHALLLTTEDCT